jgi:hypothetical protein
MLQKEKQMASWKLLYDLLNAFEQRNQLIRSFIEGSNELWTTTTLKAAPTESSSSSSSNNVSQHTITTSNTHMASSYRENVFSSAPLPLPLVGEHTNPSDITATVSKFIEQAQLLMQELEIPEKSHSDSSHSNPMQEISVSMMTNETGDHSNLVNEDSTGRFPNNFMPISNYSPKPSNLPLFVTPPLDETNFQHQQEQQQPQQPPYQKSFVSNDSSSSSSSSTTTTIHPLIVAPLQSKSRNSVSTEDFVTLPYSTSPYRSVSSRGREPFLSPYKGESRVTPPFTLSGGLSNNTSTNTTTTNNNNGAFYRGDISSETRKNLFSTENKSIVTRENIEALETKCDIEVSKL